jgi:pantetheine-phosphate adenylyltransferase
MSRIGIYPGSFDAVTFGHLEIARRAAGLVDTLHWSVGTNRKKAGMFSVEERIGHIRRMVEEHGGPELRGKVVVDSYGGLLVSHARKVAARWIVRGLRPVSDFDGEFVLNGVNAAVAPEIETVFMMSSPRFQFVSSTVAKELVSEGEDVAWLVPGFVEDDVRARLGMPPRGRLALARAVVAKFSGVLAARYSEPWRAYHGMAHAEGVAAMVERHASLFADPGAALLAAWWHDAVYLPGARGNEAASAALLRSEVGGLVPEETLAAAIGMILATDGHATAEGDRALFLDMDLSVLGAPADAYDAYEAGVAAEYVPVHGEAAYRAGRAAVLRGFLARERLFATEAFAPLEGRARDNLSRALAALA